MRQEDGISGSEEECNQTNKYSGGLKLTALQLTMRLLEAMPAWIFLNSSSSQSGCSSSQYYTITKRGKNGINGITGRILQHSPVYLGFLKSYHIECFDLLFFFNGVDIFFSPLLLSIKYILPTQNIIYTANPLFLLLWKNLS